MLGGAPSPLGAQAPMSPLPMDPPPLPGVQPVQSAPGFGPVAPPVPPIAGLPGLPEGPPPVPPGPPAPAGMPGPPEGGPKKKPMVLPAVLAHDIARAYADRAVQMAATLASTAGPPDGAVPYTAAKQIKMWRSRDPSVDVAALRAQGVGEPEIMRQAYPLRTLLMTLAGRTPLERLKYAQHMKNTSASYADVDYDPSKSEDDEQSDNEPVYDSESEA